jgi:hypothetical protein
MAGIGCWSSRRGRAHVNGRLRRAPPWRGALPRGPDAHQGSFLDGVSCTGTTFCMAVGYYPGRTYYQTLTERWDGTRWSRVSSPDAGSMEGDILTGVSCTSAAFCMAAGSYTIGGRPGETLTEKWHGRRWTLVNSPNASTHGSFLNGVGCVSAAFCIAAGAYNSRGHGQPLTERWDGARWNLVKSPNPAGIQNSDLGEVSCTSARFCMAAGATPGQAVTQRWNGTRWMPVAAHTSRTQPAFYGVSCTSPRFCMAAGYQFPRTHDQTVTQTWNGTRWKSLTTPSTSATQQNALYAASCTSATFCMAVGAYSSGGTHVQTLTARWNGTRWKLVPSPNR